MSSRHRNSGRGVLKPQPSSGSSEVCTTLGEKAHSLDTSGAAFGHWLRACDARVSSSSRSSAVKSPCAPNGSSGSGGAAARKPRARLLGGCWVLDGGPGLGAGGPLRLLLPGAGIPAMPAASRYPKAPSPACNLEAGGLDQPIARCRSPQPLGPRPLANRPITFQSVGADE